MPTEELKRGSRLYEFNKLDMIHKGTGDFMFRKMKLELFDKIKNGMKTIELRLYDEKRQQVKASNLVGFSVI